ncbi:MAG: Ig-like domain-containing protein [Anaerolineae bacterium]|nr:Ig-like domain-containing protein [Anaerolineae bacterium]
MDLLKAKLIPLAISSLIGLILTFLLFFPLMAAAKEKENVSPHMITSKQVFQVDPSLIISGTYVGTVAITEPVQLGELDLAFNLTEQGNTFSGSVNLTRTLVFSGAPTLQGNLTGSLNGITPTFRLDSAQFNETVSKQQIERQFSLTGEVLQNGQILQGIYEETITGFTPEPLTSRGLFLLSRPPLPTEIERSPTLQVQVNPSPLVIDSTAAIEATLLDGGAQPIEGERITFSSDLGSISPSEADTDSNGVASATLNAGSTPGLATVTATGGGVTGTTTVLITPPAVTTLTLTAEDIRVPTGGETSLTVSLQDGLGQPVVGETIALSTTLGSVSPISTTTDATGQATATFTAGPLAGRATVTAQASGLQASVDIAIENPGISTVNLVLGADELLPGGQTSLVATVVDQFGRPVVGQLVSLFGSLGAASPSSGITDNNGQVSGTFIAGTRFGEARVTALSGSASDTTTILIRDPATAPTLTAVTPNVGPSIGGTLVTLTGSNFESNTEVYFEPTLCENISFVSSTELTCTTPPHFPAKTHVSVVNPDNQRDRLVDGFTYEGNTVLVALQSGWNFIGLPLEPDTPYQAEDVCSEINSQGSSITEIQRWQDTGWDSHVCGDSANNFDIILGAGYYVRSSSNIPWTIEGTVVSNPVPISIETGWNSISIPHIDTYTAESLCAAFSDQGIDVEQLDRWYAGRWDSHVCGMPFNDYPIVIGAGYRIKATSSGVFTP